MGESPGQSLSAQLRRPLKGATAFCRRCITISGPAQQRYKVWTVPAYFDCRAVDGTTPAVRFFRQTFPDFFKTASSHIEVLPRPRQRQAEVALCR